MFAASAPRLPGSKRRGRAADKRQFSAFAAVKYCRPAFPGEKTPAITNTKINRVHRGKGPPRHASRKEHSEHDSSIRILLRVGHNRRFQLPRMQTKDTLFGARAIRNTTEKRTWLLPTKFQRILRQKERRTRMLNFSREIRAATARTLVNRMTVSLLRRGVRTRSLRQISPTSCAAPWTYPETSQGFGSITTNKPPLHGKAPPISTPHVRETKFLIQELHLLDTFPPPHEHRAKQFSFAYQGSREHLEESSSSSRCSRRSLIYEVTSRRRCPASRREPLSGSRSSIAM